jgi:hypothetical protein
MFYSVPQSLVQLPVPTERSGTLSTRWEHHWNTVISLASHYFPVSRSAPLRATVVVTALEIFLVPSERSGTLLTRWEHHWNTVISLASHYFPVPRSAPLRATVEIECSCAFPCSFGAERNAFDKMGTPLEHCYFSS